MAVCSICQNNLQGCSICIHVFPPCHNNPSDQTDPGVHKFGQDYLFTKGKGLTSVSFSFASSFAIMGELKKKIKILRNSNAQSKFLQSS